VDLWLGWEGRELFLKHFDRPDDKRGRDHLVFLDSSRVHVTALTKEKKTQKVHVRLFVMRIVYYYEHTSMKLKGGVCDFL